MKENLNNFIAEAAGWTALEDRNSMAPQGIWYGYPPNGPIIGNKISIPDFFGDLNAINKAEKSLTDEEYKNEYIFYLFDIITQEDKSGRLISASAAHRAKAFLKVKKKL